MKTDAVESAKNLEAIRLGAFKSTHFLAALAVTDRTSASQRKVTTFRSSSTHPYFIFIFGGRGRRRARQNDCKAK